ncbi:Protein csh3, partial [Elasticomyces elasticus]
GLRTVTAGAYGGNALPAGETMHEKIVEGNEGEFIGREDSLRVLAASNTICALVLVGVLVLQAGQWYAQRKETEEMEQMDKVRDEKRATAKAQGSSGGSKKKQ